MLNFTVRAGEYFNIGDDIRVVILGGCANNCRVMVDAPREYNIVRGKVLERNAVTKAEKEKLGRYYPEPKLSPEEVRRLIAKQRRQPRCEEGGGKSRTESNKSEDGTKNRAETACLKRTKNTALGLMRPEKAAGQ
ncbi:MAG: carbon storage regulator [Lachnospiraceae bacterium]|nr:carbon storage regulator [Lachnospiraceae bacterium]